MRTHLKRISKQTKQQNSMRAVKLRNPAAPPSSSRLHSSVHCDLSSASIRGQEWLDATTILVIADNVGFSDLLL